MAMTHEADPEYERRSQLMRASVASRRRAERIRNDPAELERATQIVKTSERINREEFRRLSKEWRSHT